MTDTVIRFDNIGKQYRLGLIGTGTLSQDLNRWWAKMRGKDDPFLKVGEENDRTKADRSGFVWALRNISFDVQQGDVVGIIGKNGAGKSTLLKILSSVTSPSVGTIGIRGRIASLLEVGTGFHPEMTGRENIYMNGSIMGMTKAEIRRKFDEIVDFAGVTKYVDTPVKRYSSGMKVRLGFAIAAHLEPEILVVDEVLAVGDAEFQKKAIGKMQNISHVKGRTVLFVSHNMTAVQTLCTRGILLDNGVISYMGSVNETIAHYLSSTEDVHCDSIIEYVKHTKSTLHITNIEINGTSSSSSLIMSGQKSISVLIEGETAEKMTYDVMLVLKNLQGMPYAKYAMGYVKGDIRHLPAGPFSIRREIALPHIINKGMINVDLFLHHPMVEYLMKAPNCCILQCQGFQMGFGGTLRIEDSGFMGLDNYASGVTD